MNGGDEMAKIGRRHIFFFYLSVYLAIYLWRIDNEILFYQSTWRALYEVLLIDPSIGNDFCTV